MGKETKIQRHFSSNLKYYSNCMTISMNHAQKLKLFPATLKDSALKWFMSLGVHSITTRGQMKEAFLGKYRDYCMPSNLKDEDFKMTQK